MDTPQPFTFLQIHLVHLRVADLRELVSEIPGDPLADVVRLNLLLCPGHAEADAAAKTDNDGQQHGENDAGKLPDAKARERLVLQPLLHRTLHRAVICPRGDLVGTRRWGRGVRDRR